VGSRGLCVHSVRFPKQKKPHHEGKASPFSLKFSRDGFDHHKAQSGQMSGLVKLCSEKVRLLLLGHRAI